ncbi:MAG: hypothetical protein H6851_20035 [Geminicoccaceae bacterium]|nr:hypothetical protein [Geminicoccaceae bacterium]MCB9945898.1 hypothetical protein [Geminicoccaceae bacterium]
MQRTVVALLAILAVNSCGGQSYTAPEVDELKPGRGLFTGDEGAFVIRPPASTMKPKKQDRI